MVMKWLHLVEIGPREPRGPIKPRGPRRPYVGKHLSLRGGIDFEGPWRDLGGEPKESPSLRGESENLTNFRGGILSFWGENWPKNYQRVPLLKGGNLNPKFFWGGISFRLLYACPRMYCAVFTVW